MIPGSTGQNCGIQRGKMSVSRQLLAHPYNSKNHLGCESWNQYRTLCHSFADIAGIQHSAEAEKTNHPRPLTIKPTHNFYIFFQCSVSSHFMAKVLKKVLRDTKQHSLYIHLALIFRSFLYVVSFIFGMSSVKSVGWFCLVIIGWYRPLPFLCGS